VGRDYLLFTTFRNFRIHPGTAAAPETLPVLEPFNYGIKEVVPAKAGQLYVQIIDRVMAVPLSVLFSGKLQGPFLTGIDSVRIYQLKMAPDSSFWLSNVNGIYAIKGTRAVPQPQFGNLRLRQMTFCRNYLAGIDPSNRLILVRDYGQSNIHIDSSVKNDCIWDKFYRLTDSSILVTTNNYYRLITFGNTPPGYRINTLEYPFIPQLAEHIAADNHRCYFFKNMAVTGIPIRELIQEPELPRLYFTVLKTGKKSLAADTFLRLGYKESRDMSLYYNTLSFNTAAISFEQSIHSGERPEHWTRSNGSNIDLFHIAHGTYYISIRARTFGGRYSIIQTLQLQIVPPFWFSWWFLVLIIAVTALLVFVVVRAFARRRLAQKERENKFLRSEFTALNALMNPHFVFNSLNSVQSLINKEDLESANQYVRTISDLLRQNMHNISRELIPLEKELELIVNYLKLEKLRFKERLQYHIDLAQDVDEEFVMIPPLLVQPLVENAIKYTLAFSEISTGEINIRVYNDRDKTIIEVTDNGKGLNAAKIQREPGHQSTALENIRTRLEQLSQIHNKTYLLEIMELKDGPQVTGTRARISIEL
jgi:two-component sensor histidine kinase